MSNLRDEIPRLAFIEAQVIHQAVPRGALAESVRAVETQYGQASGSLGDGVFLESRVVTLLYCLVVIPKQIWAFKKEHPVYQAIAKTWSVPEWAVSLHRNKEEFQKQPAYHFIHHIRNAVAHVNFSFEGPQFVFWDLRPNETKPSFRASIATHELLKFLEIVGALLANLKSDAAAQQ